MNAKPSTQGPATLEVLGNGRFKVRGPLDAETATALLERSEEAFRGSKSLEIDLGGVPEGDSAGLALLIEWIRLARKQKQQLQFKNLPTQIAALARISQVDELLMQKGA
jgi:phospholipid transport system transporter-binding protein